MKHGDYLGSIGDYWTARAELERAAGGPLTAPLAHEKAMTRTLVRNALAAMHLTKRSQMIGMGSAVSQALVGAWRLVSSEFRLSSGEVIHPYGTDAVGLLHRGRPE